MNQLDFWHDDNNLANIKNGLLVLNGLLMVMLVGHSQKSFQPIKF